MGDSIRILSEKNISIDNYNKFNKNYKIILNQYQGKIKIIENNHQKLLKENEENANNIKIKEKEKEVYSFESLEKHKIIIDRIKENLIKEENNIIEAKNEINIINNKINNCQDKLIDLELEIGIKTDSTESNDLNYINNIKDIIYKN